MQGLAVGIAAIIFFSVIASSRVSLMSGSAFALAALLAIVVVNSTLSQRWGLVVFLFACTISGTGRQIGGIDAFELIAVAILVTISLEKTPTSMPDSRGTKRYGSRLLLIPILFLMSYGITTLLNGGLSSSVPWLSGVIFCLTLVALPESSLPTPVFVFRVLTATLSLTVAVDTVLYLTGAGRSADVFNFGRFVGGLNDYELSAEIYGLAILCCVLGMLIDRNKRWRLLYSMASIPAFVLLLGTESRGPFILVVAILAVVYAIFITPMGGTQKDRGFVLGLLAIQSSVTTVIFLALGGSTLSRLSILNTQSTLEANLNREQVWGYFTNLTSFRDAGMFGNGFLYPYESIHTYPHSLYLWSIWSSGYIGFGLLMLTLVWIAVTLIRQARKLRGFALVALVLIGYLATDQTKIEVSRYPASVNYFWLILGFAIVVIRSKEKAPLEKN